MVGTSDTNADGCDVDSDYLMTRMLEIAVGVVLLILVSTMVLVVLFAALSGKICAKMILMTTDDDEGDDLDYDA